MMREKVITQITEAITQIKGSICAISLQNLCNHFLSNLCNPSRRRRERGVVSAEMGLFLAFVIAGLVGTSIYFQRGLQGGVYSTTKSFGSYFNPDEPYTVRKGLGMTETTVRDVSAGMVEAQWIPTEEVDEFHANLYGNEHPKWVLESLPQGHVPREPAGYWRANVTATWGNSETADYESAR